MSTVSKVDSTERYTKERTEITTSRRDLGGGKSAAFLEENMGCGASSHQEVMSYTGAAPTTTHLETTDESVEALHANSPPVAAKIGRSASPQAVEVPLMLVVQASNQDEADPQPPTTKSERPAEMKKSDVKGSLVLQTFEVQVCSSPKSSHPGRVESCVTLEEQITKLYGEILDPKEELMAWDTLNKNSSVLANGLLALGIGLNVEDFIELSFKEFESNTTGIACEVFQKKLKEEWEISRKLAWLSQTDVLRCIAKSLSPALDENDPLSGIRALNEEDVLILVQNMCTKIAACLYLNIEAIPKVKIMEEFDFQNNSKFCVDPTLFTMKYGGLEDFDKGVRELVGAPHPQVWDEINKEHRQRGDSERPFSPGNYDTPSTTPKEEFLVVIDPKAGKAASKNKRKVKPLEVLKKEKMAIKAKLWKEELLGLSLYTGPMFYKYNAVLRKFPKEAYDSCKVKDDPCACNKDGKNKDGLCSCYNTYPTTINAILSGLRKLMWVAPLPKDRFVYRGLSGMNLPDQFFKQDEYGVRGGTEFGMMSTSTDINVAIHYTGCEKGKQMPTVFKIGVGAINRGASLEFCSQYAGEKEILFSPLSYLEVVGEISYTITEHGTAVRIVPLQIIANLNSPGLEELIGMRKKLYIDSFDHQHHNLKRELFDLIKVTDSEFCLNVKEKDQIEVINEVESQFKEVMEKHKRRPAKWYNDDGRYRSAVIEMLNMKENAMAVPKLSMVMYEEWKVKQKFLRQANRMVSKERSRALRTVGNDSDQRKTAAFELCKANGLVAEQLEERNEMSETPLIREAADGDARAVLWLLEAGADVHARMHNEMGFTAINQAAYFGNKSCIKHLLEYKADPCVVDRSGGTPLVAAALNGELECLQLLLQAGADRTFNEKLLWSQKSKAFFNDLATKVEECKRNGKDPEQSEEIKNLRKQRDMLLNGERLRDKEFELEYLEELSECRPQEQNQEKSLANLTKVKYINKATFPNLSTPLMKAAVNGHVSCVRVLILAGADKDLVNAKGQTAKIIVLDKIRKIKDNMKKKNTTREILDEIPSRVISDTQDRDETSLSFLGDSLNQPNDLLERFEKCSKALDMTSEEIRMEDSAEVMGFDASRKDSHLKTFENQALNLKQELERLIDNSKDSWCDHKCTKDRKDNVVDGVVKQFKDLLEKHKTRNPKWYNDGGKYRSAVSEMLSMKENAMAVPRLSMSMFVEWESKQNFLRQANRMVNRESLMALREKPGGSEERRSAALDLCKSSGIVTEMLEERNEMSETPLIREAADGNAKNLLLLLEAGAEVTAKQDHKIGFTAMNQAAYFGHAPCLRHLLDFKADVNIMDAYGGTPLVAAALNGEEECVKVLIEAGADVNQPTSHGNTPLMKAALNGHSRCVRMLIVAGADVTFKNKEGQDAHKLAKEKISPLMDELVEFQKEYCEPQTHIVTYDGLKGKGYASYSWDATIEPSGGFRYKTTNGDEETEPIDLVDIGAIKPCDPSSTFCCKTNISGLSKVTVSSVPSGTPYGWDHDANCWTYFTDASSDMPTHFANFTKQGPRASRTRTLEHRKQQMISPAEKAFREAKHSALRKEVKNYMECVEAIGKSVEDIREEDWARVKEKDATRKDSHMKTFEMQALALKRELESLIKVSTSEFCCVVNNQERQDIVDQVVRQFKVVKQQHQERSPKWYNDDGRYRSGVIEMLSMKDNAMAVPRLTMTMYQEWKSKQSFLRQADRMVSRERFRAIREAPQWSDERKLIALEASKAVGSVMERLEERNEMSETPLIREAADGNAKNVLLLLEAGADVDAQQMNNIGFTALNQSAYFGHPQCIKHLLKFRAEVDSLDAYGGTPLVAAALNGELECVQALLEAGADVNHSTTNLNTPLMKAAVNGHVACVRVLMGWKADSTKKNNQGKTAMDLAVDSKEREEKRLQEIEEICHDKGSIDEKRQRETIKRLKKLIEDHHKVIEDLGKTSDYIRLCGDYADLFEDSAVAS